MELHRVLSAESIKSDPVVNKAGEDMGTIKELMIDLQDGRIAYAVLSFGGLMGMGEKLFAIPWEFLDLDTTRKVLVLDMDKDKLEKAPGFDKNHWPDFTNPEWRDRLRSHYGARGTA
jgi:sporulation protein YlmC with PRC-barrel domain